MVLYLVSKYTGREQQSFEENCQWLHRLERPRCPECWSPNGDQIKVFTGNDDLDKEFKEAGEYICENEHEFKEPVYPAVFSPVMESHHYAKWQRVCGVDPCPHLGSRSTELGDCADDECRDYEKCKDRQIYSHADWLRRDVQKLESWLMDDYGIRRIERHEYKKYGIDSFVGPHVKRIWNEYPALREYDSGVGLVLLPSAYQMHECPLASYNPGSGAIDTYFEYEILSEGARIKINWAIAHHVLVITAEVADTVPPEEWKDHALNEALMEGSE